MEKWFESVLLRKRNIERTLRKGGQKETEASEFSWPRLKVSFIEKAEMQLKL